jgi:hypothetical protein
MIKVKSEISKEECTVYFEVLTELRDSGEINMFGAPRLLSNLFGLDKKVARRVFGLWCESLESS